MKNNTSPFFHIKRSLEELKKISGIRTNYDFRSDCFLVSGKNKYHVERVVEDDGFVFLNVYVISDLHGVEVFDKAKHMLSIAQVVDFIKKNEKM